MLGLDQTATVYKRGPTGAFDVVTGSALAVRLCAVSSEGAVVERTELAGTRRLLWGPGAALPEGCEVEVEGERWTVQRGTQARLRGPDGAVVYQRCEVVRSDA